MEAANKKTQKIEGRIIVTMPVSIGRLLTEQKTDQSPTGSR